MKGFYISATGVIQGHYGPLVSEFIIEPGTQINSFREKKNNSFSNKPLSAIQVGIKPKKKQHCQKMRNCC